MTKIEKKIIEKINFDYSGASKWFRLDQRLKAIVALSKENARSTRADVGCRR